MCESSCTMRTCCWLQILFGAMFGVAGALAYFFMPCLMVGCMEWLMFGLSVLAIIGTVAMLMAALHNGEGFRSCLCGCGKSLLWAAFGTLIVCMIAMLLDSYCFLIGVFLFGLSVAFFAALVTALLRTLACEFDRLCDRPRSSCRDCDEDDETYRR